MNIHFNAAIFLDPNPYNCSGVPNTQASFIVNFVNLENASYVEIESFPFSEATNQLAGAAVFCFGISILALVSIAELILSYIHYDNVPYQMKLAVKYLEQ